jgi:hypothetical protein
MEKDSQGMTYMDQGHRRPPAARWLQPNPVPFWGSRLFRWNLILCSLILSIAAVWLLVMEPKANARAREESLKANAALKFTPRDPASKEPRAVRFDGMLDKAKDDVSPDVRDEPYRTLVKYMATVDPSRLAEQARNVDYATLMAQPEEVRGLTVRLNLMYWSAPSGPVRLDPPVGGVETVTRAYFATSSLGANEIHIVDFVEPPPAIEPETYVVLDAVFLRRVSYERELPGKETKFHQAPLFVARNIAKVEPPRVASAYRFRGLVVLLGLGLFGFLSLITIKSWMAARSGGPVPRRIPD